MRIVVMPNVQGAIISPEIYGHFAEHLGRCIYSGLYVGDDPQIPNLRGMRRDVVDALRRVRVPVLRWPGGCFADEYHWQHGIGPSEQRRCMVNNHWGKVVEDNSFGTHEFMELCDQLGCKAYINMNLGSGTVQEMQDWVEYLTAAEGSSMAELRRKNGRAEPFHVPYIGVGNENWGCGGSMRAEYYADEYRRYQTYVRSHSGNRVYKIACGPGTSMQNPGFCWTETMMRMAEPMMDGLSLHYYTIEGESWEDKGCATEFDEAGYYATLLHAQFTDRLLSGHEAIMDRYDPKRRVGIIFDEWGTWHNVEPDTNPGFLYQQNTMRDAQVAAISLNTFNRHAERVRMANLAQTVNVLQAMVLTEGSRMVLTPTYHVFDLFSGHQGATLIACAMENETIDTATGPLARISASASRDGEGRVLLTLANADAVREAALSLRLDGGAYVLVSARKLTGDMRTHNTFDSPDTVGITPLEGVTVRPDATGTEVSLLLPPCSVAAITFERA